MIYQVWVEGYAATGESGRATYFGEYEADSFEQACQKSVDAHGGAAKCGGYNNAGKHPSVWACRMFDNETDARKAYG